jgi:PqqD family protein of HPr-rel-A system
VSLFCRCPGVLVEQVGSVWAAYSPLSGGSHLLNDESAAIIEALETHEALSAGAICELLAGDCGLAPAQIEAAIGFAWAQLVGAGLIHERGGEAAGEAAVLK